LESRGNEILAIMNDRTRETFDAIYLVSGCDVRSELAANMGAHHNTIGCLEVEARAEANDADAIEKAKRLVNGRDIELWSGPRFVAKLEPKPE
jgi:hypothetical protein